MKKRKKMKYRNEKNDIHEKKEKKNGIQEQKQLISMKKGK